MKKRIKVFLLIISLILLVGCSFNSEPGTVKGLTEENKYIYDFLLSGPLDNNKVDNKRFYLFSEDGRFIYTYTTEIMYNDSPNVLMNRGTWELDGLDLILHRDENITQVPNRNGFKLEYTKNKVTEIISDLHLITYDENKQYLYGNRFFYVKNIENEEYINEVRNYLKNGIKKVNIDRLKELENK